MQRSDGRSDTDASTSANGAESATKRYILRSKLEEILLGEGRSHDGSFLKDFGEVLGNLPYLADRARLIYKMFHGIRIDVGEMFYAHILNLAVLQKEGGKKDTRWLILPRTIFGVLQTQFELERKPREKLSPIIPYKKDSRLGEIYLKNQERTAPSGYVPPRQSPRAAGKFQIIHLGSIAAPGQPIDAEEAKLVLDTTSEAIQQLATVMQILTSVVGQIASMMFPRGEEEADDPQKQDDQRN
ncbi:hypothetical protein F2Q69_00058807 [Brassica cretica]|uniref:Uncharacterized protein n=1 Tax=Brassica cretica TaxID=69181 RepID=A0A8S9RAI2_BRACR|nr:hypothetical protein F2Q69_00058807 [Brassica cretica]